MYLFDLWLMLVNLCSHRFIWVLLPSSFSSSSPPPLLLLLLLLLYYFNEFTEAIIFYKKGHIAVCETQDGMKSN